jgi:hypothetical protein
VCAAAGCKALAPSINAAPLLLAHAVTGHGIPQPLIDAHFEQSKAFFSQSDADKQAHAHSKQGAVSGYKALGSFRVRAKDQKVPEPRVRRRQADALRPATGAGAGDQSRGSRSCAPGQADMFACPPPSLPPQEAMSYNVVDTDISKHPRGKLAPPAELLAGPAAHHMPVWPASDVLPGYKATILDYFTAVSGLSDQLLKVCHQQPGHRTPAQAQHACGAAAAPACSR